MKKFLDQGYKMQNFWESDRSKTFSSMLEDLKKVSYFEGLGSLYDKSKRIEKISDFISKEINISNVKPIKRADFLRLIW